MKFVDLSGQSFGLWTVIEKSHVNKSGYWMWKCRCQCGVEQDVNGGDLRRKRSKSCKNCCKTGQPPIHGMTLTPTFKSWASMHQRCNNPNDPSYERYGGAGIQICERWLGNFQAFLDDMGVRPANMTLDRIDRSSGYEPGNCRWATAKQQLDNRKTTHWIDAFGQRKTISDWGRETGLALSAISDRIKRGMTPEQALSTPSRKHKCRDGGERSIQL